jgi:hypothetical protein
LPTVPGRRSVARAKSRTPLSPCSKVTYTSRSASVSLERSSRLSTKSARFSCITRTPPIQLRNSTATGDPWLGTSSIPDSAGVSDVLDCRFHGRYRR